MIYTSFYKLYIISYYCVCSLNSLIGNNVLVTCIDNIIGIDVFVESNFEEVFLFQITYKYTQDHGSKLDYLFCGCISTTSYVAAGTIVTPHKSLDFKGFMLLLSICCL